MTDIHPIIELSRQVADDDAASELLSAIFRHQEAERDHVQNTLDAISDRDRAEASAVLHAVRAMLARREAVWGGTVREYEAMLDRLETDLHTARYDHDVRDWYTERIAAARADGTQFTGTLDAVHPRFQVGRGSA